MPVEAARVASDGSPAGAGCSEASPGRAAAPLPTVVGMAPFR